MTRLFPLLGIPSPGYTPQETLTLSVNASRGGEQTPDYKEAIIYSSFYDLTPIIYFPLKDGARSSQTIVTTALSGKFGLRLFDFTEEPLSIFIEINITGGQELILDLAGGGSGGILDFPSLVGKGKLSGYFQLDSLPEGVTYSDITIRAFYIDYMGGKFNGLQAAQVKCQSSGLWLIEGISEHHRYNVVISIPGYNDIIYGNKATSDHVPRIEPVDPDPEEPVDPVDPEPEEPEPEEPIDPEPGIEYLVFEVMASVDENQYTSFRVWPTAGGSGVTIDMGDGEVYVYHDMTEFGHTFYSPGTYQIKISGDLSALTFRIPAPTKILSWGKELKGVSAYGSRFEIASSGSNIISVPDHLPPWISTLEYFFEDCVDFNQDISSWDTKNVKYMDGMFYKAENFNQDLSGWCVPHITSEPYDFDTNAWSWVLPKPVWGTCPTHAEEPVEPDLPVGNEYINVVAHADGGVTYVATEAAEAGNFYEMGGEWYYVAIRASDLKSKLSNWNKPEYGDDPNTVIELTHNGVSKPISASRIVTTRADGNRILFWAKHFNQHIGTFDTSKWTSLSSTFEEAALFNQPLKNWDTSNITNMTACFVFAESFNQDISRWDVSNVTHMSETFKGASEFNQDIGGWDVGNVVNMGGMFADAIKFNQDIGSWDVSNVTYMGNMFWDATAFNQDLSGWCVGDIDSWDPPERFDIGADSWTLPRPVWGTCPRGEDLEGPTEPELPDEIAYISVIEHADGGVTYVADPAAETKSFYELDGKWFYVASSAYDLHAKLSLWDDPQYSDDPHTELLVTEGDRSELITADRIVTSLTKSGGGLAEGMEHFNQYIGSFDTSNWESFSNSFKGTGQFNQPIGNWNTSKGRQFHTTFADAMKFNQPLPWDVSGCTIRSYMLGMFWDAPEFNQDLSGWCVPEIETEPDAFSAGATAWVLPKPIWGTCPS